MSLLMKVSLLFLALCVSCGDSDGGESGPDAGSGGVDAAPGATQSLTCNSGDVTFPSLDKSCDAVTECAVAIHQTDCCGNTIAVGINAASVTTFDQVEAMCSSMFPDCGCPSGPTEAEDGNSAFGSDEIGLECRDNLCKTLVITP